MIAPQRRQRIEIWTPGAGTMRNSNVRQLEQNHSSNGTSGSGGCTLLMLLFPFRDPPCVVNLDRNPGPVRVFQMPFPDQPVAIDPEDQPFILAQQLSNDPPV